MSAATREDYGPVFRESQWVMTAPIVEWANLGPVVRARTITREGYGAWQFVAIALSPRRYVRAVSNVGDVSR